MVIAMTKYVVNRWQNHADDLKSALENEDLLNVNYEDLVKLVVGHILNKDLEEWEYEFDEENITVIDDGDYQGDLLFVVHRDKYQPGANDYIITFAGYGSCSGCDALLRAQDKRNTKIIDDVMLICKDIACNIKMPYKDHFDNDEFDEVVWED